MTEDWPDFTPVHVLTGFLGSGKTTLLGRLLRDPALADTAVLINEFGEIGLDHHLLGRIDETTVLLSSGCLCCTIRGEVSDAIKRLLSQRERRLVPAFRRLVIETSGLADPFPVLTTIAADPVLKHHVRAGAVIATVDAVNGADQLRRQPETSKQVALADTLVLTKTDLVAPAETEPLVTALEFLNPDARLLLSASDAIDAADLLADRLPYPSPRARLMRCVPVGQDAGSLSGQDAGSLSGQDAGCAPGHDASARSFCVVADRPIDWTGFGFWLSMLLHRHGDAVLRVKGLLNVEGSPTPVAIHGVQQLVHPPRHLDAWPDDDRRSRIVFIVRGLDPAIVSRSMRAFGLLPGACVTSAA